MRGTDFASEIAGRTSRAVSTAVLALFGSLIGVLIWQVGPGFGQVLEPAGPQMGPFPGGGPPMFSGPPGGFRGFGGERGPMGFVRPEGGPPWMRGGMPGQMPFGPPGTFGPPGGFDRREGDRGRSEGGSSDRSGRFEGFLRSLDTNRDGVIDPREIPEERRRFFNFMAERAGIDPNRPIPIERALELARSRGDSRSGDRGSDRSTSGSGQQSGGQQSGGQSSQRSQQQGSSSGSAPALPTLVAGFGVSPAEAASLSFGQGVSLSISLSRYLTSPPATPISSGNRGSAGSDPDRERRIREFAESILRRNDRNQSGRLEQDEWGELRGNPKEMDRNGDGVITLEELQQYVADFGRRREGSSGGPPSPGLGSGSVGPSGGGSSGSAASIAGTRFVRFRRPHELLPPGLPEWFIAKDKDEDGQVSMAEYATTWNDALVAEFLRYDLDNDGFITPRECLAALAGAQPLARLNVAPGGLAPTGGTQPGETGSASPQPGASAGSTSGSSSGGLSRSGSESSSRPRSAWDDPGSNFW